MAKARLEAEWDRTSHLLWLTAEVNRDRKKRSRAYTPADFHPFKQKAKRRTITVEDLTREILLAQESRTGRR